MPHRRFAEGPSLATAPRRENLSRSNTPLLRRLSRGTDRFERPVRDALSDASSARPASKAPSPLRGVVFEMDNVLYDATLWRRWLLQVLGRLGVYTHYQSLFRLWQCDYLDDVHCGRREHDEALQAFLFALGLSRAQIDEVQAASQAKRRELVLRARAFPGVWSTLSRLRNKGLLLGVLSDSEATSDMLGHRLAQMGLGAQFAAVVSSVDLERTKPDPLGYLTVLEAMNLEPHQAIFVGQDGEELAGAAAVGMQTLAFNYAADMHAEYEVQRFEQLLELLPCDASQPAGA